MIFQSSKEITVNVKTPKDKKSIKVGEKATIKEVILIKLSEAYPSLFSYFQFTNSWQYSKTINLQL